MIQALAVRFASPPPALARPPGPPRQLADDASMEAWECLYNATRDAGEAPALREATGQGRPGVQSPLDRVG